MPPLVIVFTYVEAPFTLTKPLHTPFTWHKGWSKWKLSLMFWLPIILDTLWTRPITNWNSFQWWFQAIHMPSCRTKSLWCLKSPNVIMASPWALPHNTHFSPKKFMTTWCQFYHQYVANDTVHNCMHDLSKSFHHDLLATIRLTWETSHIRRTICPIVTSKVIGAVCCK